jgi:hypothetical protein
LDFPRSDPRYSPICKVRIYNTGTAGLPIAQLPTSAAAIAANFPTPTDPTPVTADSIAPSDVIPPFVFCLQAQ